MSLCSRICHSRHSLVSHHQKDCWCLFTILGHVCLAGNTSLWVSHHNRHLRRKECVYTMDSPRKYLCWIKAALILLVPRRVYSGATGSIWWLRVSWPIFIIPAISMYHQFSKIRRTQSQNIIFVRLVLQLPWFNPLKPGVKLRMKM